ncbi:sulfatase [Flavilitoribacter nigricans]|uniref:Sulfatase n=1 Tax=Flavilitoribacter nigricans (strain ATCC 23147 / DSM 23189 / NBRC 102662 / NCIMB 1420 / SS-2) TaxID=1122177 RepID=A0A2D0NDV7_FLAN2|nr:sulfatase [Flavilitoribacter nigricans]PHN06556.1 sulfatase [Flavilitoribacter nigricans DSM 23189 = NBRC 102662]
MKYTNCQRLLLPLLLILSLSTLSAQPRNILFIAVDDLKPLLGAYGCDYMHTPNMDRLARMGASFLNAQVQQAVCGPSRASIMTGAYPDRTRVWDLHTDFRKSAPELISMPEYLISQGYTSTGIGKIYHKGSSSPGHDGKSWSIPHVIPDNYESPDGRPALNTYQDKKVKKQIRQLTAEAKVAGIKGNGKIRSHVLERIKPSTEATDVPDNAYQDGLYTEEAIRRLQSLQAAGDPFFLAVGFQRPHLPFVAPKKYWDLYDREDIELAAFRQLAEGTPKIAYHSFGELRSYTDIDNDLGVGDELPVAKQKELIHGYMACVSYIDAQVGKLLDALEALSMLDNTLIVLWGDHGFHLGDHTLWCKHSNFEQATRIPLLFAGPGVAAGTVVRAPIELVDVFPTLFDLAGVDLPARVDGKSLAPLMDSDPGTTVEKDYAISQYHRGKKVMGYSLRTERYRLTQWYDNSYRSFKPLGNSKLVGVELYDYETDPNERRNLADLANYREIKKELEQKLATHLQQQYQTLSGKGH